MARWEERIENNEARQQLDGLEAELNLLAEKIAADAVNPFLLRFRRVISGTRERLDVADPAMVGHRMLAEVSEAVQSVRAQFIPNVAAMASGDQAALDALDSRFDELAAVVARNWAPPPPARETQRLRRAISEVDQAAQRFEEQLEERVRSAEATTAQAQQQAEQTARQASESVERLRARVEDLEATIAVDSQRLQEALSNFQGTFDTQQQERTNQFATLLAEERERASTLLMDGRDQVATVIEEAEASFEKRQEDVGARFAETLRTLEDHLSKAEEIMGAIGATGMTAGYDKYGSAEERSFRSWRWITVVLGAFAAIGLSVLVVLDHSNALETPDVSKIALTAAFAGLASYCARQAGSHRRTARHMRAMALAIASLGPYLQSLEPGAREEVLRNFAYFFFSRQFEPDHEADDFRHGQNYATAFIGRFVRPPDRT